MMDYLKIEQISPICSFKDKDLELSFENQSFRKFKKKVIPFFAMVMAVFISFCIPDLVMFPDRSIFIRSLAIRLSAAGLCVVLYFVFGRLKSSVSYLLIISVAEFSSAFFYPLILSGYLNMNFSIKCIDIIILITLFFSLPNRWINAFLAALSLIASFAAFSFINAAKFTQNNSFAAGGVYITIAFLLNALNFYRVNYYKRTQFYNINALKRLLNTDTLTGAYTRAKFNRDIERQIALSAQAQAQAGRKFSITIFDIDDFKKINDTYGHIEGDGVLTEIARTVTQNKRQHDIFTRWGGEEFVIIFPATGIAAAEKITKRICRAISLTDFSIGERVTCSFGVTEFRTGDTAVSMMRRADKLMYDAKASGKNIVASDMQ